MLDGYVEDHVEYTQLKNYIFDNNLYIHKYRSQYISAFDFLKQILHRMYGTTSISILVNRSFNIDESKIFSRAMNDVYPMINWSYNTTKCILCYLKKILRETAINPSFLDKLSLKSMSESKKRNELLTKIVNKLDDNDVSKKELERWINIIRHNTKNRSDSSIKMMMYYYINEVVPNLGINLYNFNPSDVSLDINIISKIADTKTKRSRFKTFLRHILLKGIDEIDRLFFHIKSDKKEDVYDDGSDKHTFTADELDKLYNQIKGNLRNELIYLLLITTGMRVGGLVKIKIDNVAIIKNDKIEIKKFGQTIEKGSKWFNFVINNRVRELMYLYIESKRRSDSIYLFPSNKKDDHISTSTIRMIIKNAAVKAGITGAHVHPHSLRHSYAHILLDCGNNPSIVSKLLGHSNVTTTQAFYLKENTIDVVRKADIPWLDKSTIEKKKIIPDFLKSTSYDKISSEKRRNKQIKLLTDFLK